MYINKKEIIIAIVAFIAGFAVYDIFVVDLYLTTKAPATSETSRVSPICPGEKFVYDTGFTWTEKFWQENPNATDADWVEAWNSMLREVGCDDYQATVADIRYSGILADLIYASSTNEITCPTEDEVSGVFEHWYNYYMRGSATSTYEGAMRGWDELMLKNGCLESINKL